MLLSHRVSLCLFNLTSKNSSIFAKMQKLPPLYRAYSSSTRLLTTPDNTSNVLQTMPFNDASSLGKVAITETVEGITTVGAWEYSMTSSILWPSNLIERALELLHFHSGFSWGATLIVYTLTLRTILLPAFIKQSRATVLANNLKPKVEKLQADSQHLRSQGRTEESRAKIRELATFMSINGINPLKILGLSILPLPFFMSTFFAIRNIAAQPIASLAQEGMLWINDLSAADPFYILPIASTIALLSSIEVTAFLKS